MITQVLTLPAINVSCN